MGALPATQPSFSEWLQSGHKNLYGTVRAKSGRDQCVYIQPDAYPTEWLYLPLKDWPETGRRLVKVGDRVMFDVPEQELNEKLTPWAANLRRFSA